MVETDTVIKAATVVETAVMMAVTMPVMVVTMAVTVVTMAVTVVTMAVTMAIRHNPINIREIKRITKVIRATNQKQMKQLNLMKHKKFILT
jgi:hypothetical protein